MSKTISKGNRQNGAARDFLKWDKMEAKKCWITAVVLLAGLHLCLDRCMGTEPNRFQSEINGYSFTIPEGWIQMSDDSLRQALDKLPSGEAKQRLLSQYEAGFQLETADQRLQYPFLVVEVIDYSEDGLNGQPDEDGFDNLARHIARMPSGVVVGKMNQPLTGVVVDKTKPLLKFELEMEVAGVGRVKTQAVGYFGRYAMVQLMFCDLESNWTHSYIDRDLIFRSFQFIPAMAYKEDAVIRFLDRWAMEVLLTISLVLIVVSVAAVYAYIVGKTRQHKAKKPNDDQEQ